MNIIFVTGIGTGIGKTVISAILTEALDADYWKPIQAGFDEGTDTEWVRDHITNGATRVHKEVYKLKLPASPHIAAREEGLTISLQKICDSVPKNTRNLIVEGAGGLMVPLNDNEFVADLIKALDAKVILISRNYLGSINHSLLTANIAKYKKLNVKGWIFNDQYLDYESEISRWSGMDHLGSIPFTENADRDFVAHHAQYLRKKLGTILW
ncbi:MAG: dethiobiotin synthase [Flavitalea sp.]